MKRLFKKAEFVQDFPIEYLKNRRGQIGGQGVETGHIYSILTNVCGMTNIPEGSDMATMVNAFKSDPNAIAALQQLCQSEPINVLRLPDDLYTIQDGHHRAFLMDQAGFTTIPANVN